MLGLVATHARSVCGQRMDLCQPCIAHDAQLQAVEAVQPLLALDHAGELADGQAVHDGDRVLADEGAQRRLQHESRDVVAAERIGPIENDEGDARCSGRLHGEPHGRDVGVEANADILNVENQDIHVAQHPRRRLPGGAVEAENGNAGLGIDAIADFGASLGGAAKSVLRGKDRGELHVRRLAQHVCQMLAAHATGVIGDEANPLARDCGEARRCKRFGAGGDRLRWGGGLAQ